MANIKDLKKRIKSTKGTLKITTAMKLVSAAKLAKAQEAITSARPYAHELDITIKTMSTLIEKYEHPYLIQNKSPHNLLLILSSNKGLCGGYTSQLTKKVKEKLAEEDMGETKIFNIGKKVKELLGKEYNYGKTYEFKKIDPSFEEMRSIASELGNLYETGEYGRIFVAYNHFHSALSFEPTVSQLLPISFSLEEKHELKKQFPFDFKYDVSPKKVLDHLIPETLVSSVYTCLLEAVASEHGARMNAMESASKNCSEMIRSLTLKMNKLRQAAITTELIEVVSGAEALNG